MPSSKKQNINFNKNTEIKYPNNDNMFEGCSNGSLLELPMISKTIIYDYGQILKSEI